MPLLYILWSNFLLFINAKWINFFTLLECFSNFPLCCKIILNSTVSTAIFHPFLCLMQLSDYTWVVFLSISSHVFLKQRVHRRTIISACQANCISSIPLQPSGTLGSASWKNFSSSTHRPLAGIEIFSLYFPCTGLRELFPRAATGCVCLFVIHSTACGVSWLTS